MKPKSAPPPTHTRKLLQTHLVEEGESLLELRDLLVSQLVGHRCGKREKLDGWRQEGVGAAQIIS